MKHPISTKDFTELQNNTKLEEDELKTVIEYLEERKLEITITTILETAIILWGLDILFD